MKAQSLCIVLSLLIISMPVCFASELRLTYDANGNLITGDGKYRVYNSLNQLWKIYQGNTTSGVLLEELTYHPVEERVLMKKIYDSGVLKKTVYYLDDNFVREINSSGAIFDYIYVYHEGSLIAQQIPGSVKQYPLTDHKGDIVTLSDSSGRTIENTTYSPFGEVTGGGELSRYGYESKEHQADCGYIPQTGLISYYSFDVDASDKMGRFNGLANGTLLSSTAILGKSYYFDGSSNNYISINKSVIRTRAFSISFWENADYAPSTSMMLVCDSNYVQNLQIYRYTVTSAVYDTSVGYTSLQIFNIPPPTYQNWKHIVLTENSSGGVKVYVNAILSDSYTGSNFTKLQSNLYLGLRGDLQRDYKGYIDELAIWNRTLTAREVKSLNTYILNYNKCQAKGTDFHFRSYVPETAQFTQPDTLIQNVYDPQMLNHYSFERNNPFLLVDPNGQSAFFYHATGTYSGLRSLGFSVVDASIIAVASMGPDAYSWYSSTEQKAIYSNLGQNYAAFHLGWDVSESQAQSIMFQDAENFYNYYQQGDLVIAGQYLHVFGDVIHLKLPPGGTLQHFLGDLALTNQALTSILVHNYIGYAFASHHLISNNEISQDQMAYIKQSMVNSATSNQYIDWYYNAETHHYQYWVGGGHSSGRHHITYISGGGGTLEPVGGGTALGGSPGCSGTANC